MMPEAARTLEELMAGYQRGEADAAVALVDALSPALRRFFVGQGGTAEGADDLLQEVWLKIHRARHTHRPGEPLLPWVYGIARHVKVDGYRRRRRRAMRETTVPELPERAEMPKPTHGPDLQALLAELPAGQREVVYLLKVADLSVDEVARATATSAGAVKQKAHRAYATLRRLLSEGKG